VAEGDGDQKKLLGESGIEAVIHFVRKLPGKLSEPK